MGHAVEVADFILREAVGPAADGGEGGVGRWERAENLGELGEGGDLVVWGVREEIGGVAAEKGSEDARAGGGAVGEFLGGEGGGEELGGRGCVGAGRSAGRKAGLSTAQDDGAVLLRSR